MLLQLDCKLDTQPGALVITWRLVNREPLDVGVFNRIRAVMPDGTYRFSPNLAWVEIEPPDGLLVQHRALPIPPGLGMAARVPPYCSRVAAGSTYDETLRLPAPVAEMQPFKRALLLGATPGEAIADVPARAARITFAVGVFPIAGDIHLVSEHPAHPDVWTATPNAIAAQEVLVRAFELTRPIEVLGYRVAPWP